MMLMISADHQHHTCCGNHVAVAGASLGYPRAHRDLRGKPQHRAVFDCPSGGGRGAFDDFRRLLPSSDVFDPGPTVAIATQCRLSLSG